MRSGQPNMAPTFDPRLAVLMVGAAQIICGISSQTEAFLCGFSVYLFQYGNVGAMAITLCQSLGQNIGMRWNNARNSAGKEKSNEA